MIEADEQARKEKFSKKVKHSGRSPPQAERRVCPFKILFLHVGEVVGPQGSDLSSCKMDSLIPYLWEFKESNTTAEQP